MINIFSRQSKKYWVLADQVVVSGSSFVTNILLARTLGLRDYGQFSVILLLQLFLLGIQQAVSSGILQVMLPRCRDEDKAFYIKGVFYGQGIWLLLLAMAAVFLFLVFPSLAAGYRGIWIPGLIATLLFLAQDFLRKTFLTLGWEMKAFGIDVITNVLQLLLLIGCMLWGGISLVRTCWIIGLTFIPSVITGIAWLRPGWFKLDALRHAWQVHKDQGSWMLLSALLQWFAGNLFVVAAGWWLGLAALGALRLAQYVFGLLNVLLQAIENYSLPKASGFAGSPMLFSRYLKHLLKRSIMIIGPVLILVVIFAKPLLTFSGGLRYTPYAFVMYGLTAAYLLVLTGIPVRIALRIKLLNRSYFTGYLLATLFSLITAKWMICTWELAGVLTGLFATQFIVLTYWLFILKRKNIIAWRSSTLY